MPLFNRNTITLVAAQIFGLLGGPILVLLGGVVGQKLAPDERLATLPLATMILGTALSTIPASLLMAKLGRRRAFLVAAFVSTIGVWAMVLGNELQSFFLFCAGTVFVGWQNAFVQQYRFAITENVPDHMAGSAISMLLLTAIVTAVAGPEIGVWLKNFFGAEVYSGSFVALSIAYAFNFLLCLNYQDADSSLDQEQTRENGRSLREIAMIPTFWLAVASSMVAYGIMSFIMTATPLSMKMDAFDVDTNVKVVIRWHIVSMFLPSLFSGFAMDRLGVRFMIFVGWLIYLGCFLVAMMDVSFEGYLIALILLGVGWNFLFVAGTKLLTTVYRPSERFRVQAVNEFLTFGFQALGSLLAGLVLYSFGWSSLQHISLVTIGLLLVLMIWERLWLARHPNL